MMESHEVALHLRAEENIVEKRIEFHRNTGLCWNRVLQEQFQSAYYNREIKTGCQFET